MWWFPVKFYQWADFQIQCNVVRILVKYPRGTMLRVQSKLEWVTVKYPQ